MSLMKYVMRAAAVALALSPAANATRAAAQALPDLHNPLVEIAYVQPANAAYQPIRDRLKKLQVLEELKLFLAPVRLPRKLTVQVDQCGAPTRPYKVGGSVTICYEMVEQIERVAAKASPNMQQTVIVGTFVQAAFHEVAEAILDVLQVPVWGRIEDAADRLAGFIMLQFGEAVARQTIIGTAVFFEISGKTWTGNQFADASSPEAQRYYNYLCVTYGANPKIFEFLVKADDDKKPILPPERARRCRGEYEQIRKAFNLRIMPHVDPDLVVRIRAAKWTVGDGK
jgi:Putative metallopeptidase